MSTVVVKIGASGLRTKVERVADFSAAKLHCETLVNGLRELRGAGLAANQIGINLNIFVAEVRPTELFPDRQQSALYEILNAEMLEHSPETTGDWEGCFSVPDLLGTVPRYNWIKIRYQDKEGATHTDTFKGYLARVFQHEMDHLAGRLYLDRMPTMLSLTTRENYLAKLAGQKT